MAIFPAKYNGINFSYDFSRESQRYDFDSQRLKNTIKRNTEIKYLSFLSTDPDHLISATLTAKSEGADVVINSDSEAEVTDGLLIFFKIPTNTLNLSENTYFKLDVTTDGGGTISIYSECFIVKNFIGSTDNEIFHITSYNNDNRHGYLTNAYPAFGFFKFSKLNSDIFINKKTEYEYSYGRRKILSSENNIGKRFTFLDLTMYQQNLLKWLCNSENLFIDGVKYQLISDFTELLADENSEVKDLRADFVEAEQSFFAIGSQTAPTNVFDGEIFMK